MPICKLCGKKFPNRLKLNGKIRNLKNRKYCLNCSGFGLHNTTQLNFKFKGKRMRICKGCGILLTKKNTYKIRTLNCKKCFNKKTNEIVIRHKKEAIKILGGKCIRCGFNGNYIVFEFHHPNSNKESSWGKLRNKKGWKFILKEIKKCQLVCANCHRIIHWEMRQKGIKMPQGY